jgi:S-DNA-T family DNA segregation ATPase FtsK/SpoIIIE
MAKKKSNKEPKKETASTHKFTGFIKNETLAFIIGLLCVIIAVYMLLAFTSFFFTGAADQSILEKPLSGELASTNNHIQNYAGARGAQVAEYLINDCFGIPAYFIAVFLAVAGLKLMKAYHFRLWKWFLSCAVLLIWGSIFLGFIFEGTFGNSFCYPGGRKRMDCFPNRSHWLGFIAFGYSAAILYLPQHRNHSCYPQGAAS